MKVFLGGSRHLAFIPVEIATKIEDLVKIGATFLVGDAPGSDSAFQQYLSKIRYQNVSVFTSASEVRNNLGKWQTQVIDSGLKSKSAASHAFKDRHMATICDFGIMIWDGISPGTLSNVIDMVEQNKEAYIYLSTDRDFFKVDSMASLIQFEAQFPEVFVEARKRLHTYRKRLSAKVRSSPDKLFD